MANLSLYTLNVKTDNLSNNKADKATTLAGYGISDAALATHDHNTLYEAKNANIQTHITNTNNPHGITTLQIGAMATSHAANVITGLSTSGTLTTVSREDHKHTPDPRTLVVPGASGAASGFLYIPTERKLASVNILCKTQAGVDLMPTAATTFIINKVVSGTTIAVATITTTTAQTIYDVSPDATIEAGAYLYATFSGSNNGVYVANIITVWA